MTKVSDADFIKYWQIGGAEAVSRQFGIGVRAAYGRRAKNFPELVSPSNVPVTEYPGRVPVEVLNGTVLVGGDAHIWPGPASTCMRAFRKFIDDVKPNAVILNGDVMDFPRISRHPQNWESAPDVREELEAVQDYLSDIVQVCGRKTLKFWCIGNHDIRFEGLFANAAPQMRGVKGVHLSDHFPAWQKAMSCMINEQVRGGETMVKHIPKGGGINATRTFALNGGISTVHNHLHSQNVRAISDYHAQDHYGVDTGMLADKEHRAFGYAQDAPLDWRPGFSLLTYREGRLMPPELVTKMSPNTVWFRGQIHKV